MLGWESRTCCECLVDFRRNLDQIETARALLRSRATAFLCVIAATFAATAHAQPLVQPPPPRAPAVVEDETADPGFFEVRSAMVELRDGVYFLNAVVAYRLSTEVRDALHSGVPLGID